MNKHLIAPIFCLFAYLIYVVGDNMNIYMYWFYERRYEGKRKRKKIDEGKKKIIQNKNNDNKIEKITKIKIRLMPYPYWQRQ